MHRKKKMVFSYSSNMLPAPRVMWAQGESSQFLVSEIGNCGLGVYRGMLLRLFPVHVRTEGASPNGSAASTHVTGGDGRWSSREENAPKL